MLEPSEEPLDFLRAYLGPGEVERHTAAKRRVCTGEPLECAIPVAFKELNGLSKEAREANEAVGFVRKESSPGLSPRQCPPRNVQKSYQLVERKRRVAPEPLECAVGDTLDDCSQQRLGFKCLESQEDDIPVRPWRSPAKLLTEPVEIPGCAQEATARVSHVSHHA